MNIYFAGAIRGGRDDAALYAEIVARLQQFGDVLSEHVADQELADTGKAGVPEDAIYERDMAWLRAAHVVVAEVTTPSLGVGYELAMAEELETPVLCLFRPDDHPSLSAIVRGSDHTTLHEYERVGELRPVFREFLGDVQADM